MFEIMIDELDDDNQEMIFTYEETEKAIQFSRSNTGHFNVATDKKQALFVSRDDMDRFYLYIFCGIKHHYNKRNDGCMANGWDDEDEDLFSISSPFKHT